MNQFTFKILWLKSSVAIAIDHIVDKGYSPLTPYFFWPRNDAWTQLKIELESKPWISKNDKIDLLNYATKIINYWQKKSHKETIYQIQHQFPHCIICVDT